MVVVERSLVTCRAHQCRNCGCQVVSPALEHGWLLYAVSIHIRVIPEGFADITLISHS